MAGSESLLAIPGRRRAQKAHPPTAAVQPSAVTFSLRPTPKRSAPIRLLSAIRTPCAALRLGRKPLSAHPPPPAPALSAPPRHGPRGIRREPGGLARGPARGRVHPGPGAADGAALAARIRLRRHLPRLLGERRVDGHSHRLPP